jgi:2-oxoglutarate ferredoxin oxidoreductase subunit beta
MTTKKNAKAKTAPEGIVESDIIPAHLALISEATFVARSFSGNPKQLTNVLEQAVKHQGFFLFRGISAMCNLQRQKHNQVVQ